MASRLLGKKGTGFGFSSFVDITINGMGAMFVFLALYVAVVPPVEPPPALRILTEQLPPAVWFQPYEAIIHVSGGAGRYYFDIESREILKAIGLEIDPQFGRIGGVPIPPPGLIPSSFVLPIPLTVRDMRNQYAQAYLALRILPGAVPFDPEAQKLRLVRNNPDLPEAWVGQPYQEDIAILGGIEPYEVTCEGLPPGLQWKDGKIEGRVQEEAVPQGKNVQQYHIRVLIRDQQTWFPSWASPPGAQVIGNFKLLVRRLLPLQYKGLFPSTARAGIPYRGFLVLQGGSGRFQITLLDKQPPPVDENSEETIPLGDSGLRLHCRTGELTGIPRSCSQEPTRVHKLSFPVLVKDDNPLLAPIEIHLSITILPSLHFLQPKELQ